MRTIITEIDDVFIDTAGTYERLVEDVNRLADRDEHPVFKKGVEHHYTRLRERLGNSHKTLALAMMFAADELFTEAEAPSEEAIWTTAESLLHAGTYELTQNAPAALEKIKNTQGIEQVIAYTEGIEEEPYSQQHAKIQAVQEEEDVFDDLLVVPEKGGQVLESVLFYAGLEPKQDDVFVISNRVEEDINPALALGAYAIYIAGGLAGELAPPESLKAYNGHSAITTCSILEAASTISFVLEEAM